MGVQDRFFARWLLPVYPVLCLLAGWAAVAAAGWAVARVGRLRGSPWPAVAAGVLLCAQGLVYSVHNDLLLTRQDTRQLARDWMVDHVPARSKVVVEPFAPALWASDPGGAKPRWNKWPTTRSKINNDGSVLRGRGRVIRFEDYERTTRPELVGSYARGGYCWVVTGSTQYGRAFAEPEEVPNAIRYYRELQRRGTLVHRVSPYGEGEEPIPFSYDFSFNGYPLRYERPGPEVRIYRLRGGDC
jgi:hypothetical protein